MKAEQRFVLACSATLLLTNLLGSKAAFFIDLNIFDKRTRFLDRHSNDTIPKE